MAEKNSHISYVEIRMNKEVEHELQLLIKDIQGLLRDAFIHDHDRHTKKELEVLSAELRVRIKGELCSRGNPLMITKVIYHNGAWGCTLSVGRFFKLIVAPVIPWAIELPKIECDIVIKKMRSCFIVRSNSHRYFPNLPRGSQMYADAGVLDSQVINAIVNLALGRLGVKEENVAKRHYPNLPGIQTTTAGELIISTVEAE